MVSHLTSIPNNIIPSINSRSRTLTSLKHLFCRTSNLRRISNNTWVVVTSMAAEKTPLKVAIIPMLTAAKLLELTRSLPLHALKSTSMPISRTRTLQTSISSTHHPLNKSNNPRKLCSSTTVCHLLVSTTSTGCQVGSLPLTT